MTKPIVKRGVCMLLVAIMCLTLFISAFSISANAATERGMVYLNVYPGTNDTSSKTAWAHGDLTYMNGWSSAADSTLVFRAVNSFTGNVAYCIEPGRPQNSGETLTSHDETYWDNLPSVNNTITPVEVKTMIGRILQYGYTGTLNPNWVSQDSADADKMAHVLATQLLIWETIVGERDADFAYVDSGSFNKVTDQLGANHPLRSKTLNYYASIEASVKNHTKVPSFAAKSASKAQTVELKWDGTRYSATLNDSNGVLGNYNFSADGLSFSKNGNTLTVSAAKAPADTVTVSVDKTNSQRKGLVTWSDGTFGASSGRQDIVGYIASVNDPVKAYFKVSVGSGGAKIVKTSEDGMVANISFTVTGIGVNETVTTNSNGEITISDLKPGTYVIAENVPEAYEPQTSKSINVVAGQTASVNFNNVLKKGNLMVTKTADDGMVEGVTFRLYGTSLSGQSIDLTAVTNAEGVAAFSNVPIGENYTLEEVNTADKYMVPDKQTVAIEWDKITNVDMNNALKHGVITVEKTGEIFASVEKNEGVYTPVYETRGLEGAVYEISRDGEVVDTITTGADGKASSKQLDLGTYEVREITAPEGMVINSEVRTVTITPTADNIAIVESHAAFTNDRQKVKIDLRKELELDEVTGIGNNGEILDVEFGLFAAEDIFAADGNMIPQDGMVEAIYVSADGTAEFTADIPFGNYYVKEIATNGRYVLTDEHFPVNFKYGDQDVPVVNIVVNEGKEIRNRIITGSVQTVKLDEEYPENKLSGAVFEIYYDVDGNGEFDAEADMLMGEMIETETGVYRLDGLRIGGYFLHEKTAPIGYAQDTGYYYFTISTDGEVVIVENEGGIGFTNTPKYVDFEITKTDIADGKLLPNAGFRIKDENGEVVAEGYTDENGVAKFRLRYGRYTYEEFDAPKGYSIDTTPHEFVIDHNGEVIKASMTNTKIPKTGDESNVYLWASLGAVALGGIIAMAIVSCKKGKKNK